MIKPGIYPSETLSRWLPLIPFKLEKIVTHPYVKSVFLTAGYHASQAKLLDPTRISIARVGFFVATAVTILALHRIFTRCKDTNANAPYFPNTALCLSLPTACLAYDLLQQSNKFAFDLLGNANPAEFALNSLNKK